MRLFRFSSAVLSLCAGASVRVQLATVSLLIRNVCEGPLGISKVYSEASIQAMLFGDGDRFSCALNTAPKPTVYFEVNKICKLPYCCFSLSTRSFSLISLSV